MSEFENELINIDIEIKDIEKTLQQERIEKAKALQLDKLLLYFYNNRTILKSIVTLKWQDYIPKENRHFKESFMLGYEDNDCWIGFLRIDRKYKTSLVYSYPGNYKIDFESISLGKRYTFANLNSSKELINIDYTYFEEWAKHLLQLYYDCSKQLEAYYNKERTKIEQLELPGL